MKNKLHIGIIYIILVLIIQNNFLNAQEGDYVMPEKLKFEMTVFSVVFNYALDRLFIYDTYKNIS
ncbi:hypothetical protein FACS189461_0560 [Spirochaetia bacterium]|nr:hypothetical protein FACS189461_0560 [Spirochaetia bacterium]